MASILINRKNDLFLFCLVRGFESGKCVTPNYYYCGGVYSTTPYGHKSNIDILLFPF